MTQAGLVVLLLKIALISAVCSLVLWVAVYHRLTHGGVWRDHLGQTLIAKSLLLAGVLMVTALSLFFNFNRQDSRVSGWLDVVLIGAITPVMIWRTRVWLHVYHKVPDHYSGQIAALRAEVAELRAELAACKEGTSDDSSTAG